MNPFNTDVLIALLRKENISEAELARRIGVSRACVNRIVKGTRQPSSKFLAGLRRAFPDYSLDYFFTESDANECHQPTGTEGRS